MHILSSIENHQWQVQRKMDNLEMIFDNLIDHEYNSRPLATDRILTGMTLMV